jgi:diguanylate cyclase (GGDEF)-like protein
MEEITSTQPGISEQNGILGRIPVVREGKNVLYMITPDQASGEILADQISHFGYQIQIAKNLSQLENIIIDHKILAILVDSSLVKEISQSSTYNKIKQWIQESVPLIFFSDNEDQATRLMSVRAGGVAFFLTPVNVVNLIDKLDKLGRTRETKPYRVMIIEDQPTVASYYEIVLKRAGMTTRVVNDPMDVLSNINQFMPDLILMDLYMPEIDGIELAQVIRQIDEYVSTPIVFLSSEEDFNKQMQAMNLGGDDFLTKPIKAGHLVALVKSRLERLRVLKSYMVRDSLTGLFNHTSVRGRLAQEIARCERHKSKLALVMLDLDNFKTVNDTYGHPTGDSVLKSLARLLQQRLRQSDVIGRYGGEEFVSILLDAEKDSAYQVMDEIRRHFSEIQHYSSKQGVFRVTFSCGIAIYPEYSSVQSLIDAADQALYEAKANGKNQVMLAS